MFAGSVLDTGLHEQQPSKNADLLTFNATLDHIMRSHFPSVYGSVAVRLISCPNICSEALSLLGRLAPVYGYSVPFGEINFKIRLVRVADTAHSFSSFADIFLADIM